MRFIDKIILHCSASDDEHIRVADITEWHILRGFTTCGYHWFIGSDGEIEKGRPEEEVGAHTEGHNEDSIGVCLNGLNRFHPEQFEALWALLYDLKKDFPLATLHGHKEFNPNKTCPNFVYDGMAQLFNSLREKS